MVGRVKLDFRLHLLPRKFDILINLKELKILNN